MFDYVVPNSIKGTYYRQTPLDRGDQPELCNFHHHLMKINLENPKKNSIFPVKIMGNTT